MGLGGKGGATETEATAQTPTTKVEQTPQAAVMARVAKFAKSGVTLDTVKGDDGQITHYELTGPAGFSRTNHLPKMAAFEPDDIKTKVERRTEGEGKEAKVILKISSQYDGGRRAKTDARKRRKRCSKRISYGIV